MKAFKILDVKDFMSKILIGEVFDQFSLIEATITTFCTFSIDGKLRQDFFDTDMKNTLTEKHMVYASWKEIRPHCYAVIRGKRTPLSFKIIFQLPYSSMEQVIRNSRAPFSADLVSGLFLNIQFRNNELLCTTGVSLKTFSPDKSLEQLWDSMIPGFLHRHQIAFEEI